MTALEAKRCTPADFQLYQKGHQVKDEAQRRLIAMQAWQNQAVQRTKKVGKNYLSAFKDFNDFYNVEDNFYASLGYKPKIRKLSMADMNKKLQQGGGR